MESKKLVTHERVNVGVIGTGGMGGRHARNLATEVAGVDVVAIMDTDPGRAEAVAADCGGAETFSDAGALIADPGVDAVVIASPDSTHAELAIVCLDAGKPVMLEKPLAASVNDAERVLDAEMERKSRAVQLGFMREFDPAHRRVRDVVDRGDIGRPLLLRGVHSNFQLGGIRSLREVISNSLVHDFHTVRWISRREISQVHTEFVAENDDSGAVQLVHVQTTLDDGSLATIQFTEDCGYGYEVDLEIVGDAGSVRTTSLTSPVVRSKNVCGLAVDRDWLQRFERAYVIELQSWVNSVQRAMCQGPSAWDGYVSLIVAEACIRSATSGTSQPVELAKPPETYRRWTTR